MTANDRDAAHGATESDFPCCEVVGEGSDPQRAREAGLRAEVVNGVSYCLDDLRTALAISRRAESAEAALASEREAHAGLRARLEALAEQLESVTVPSAEVTSWSRYFAARLRTVLAEPAAPVAAEEGGEQEAGEVERLFFVDSTTGERCPTLGNRLCTVTDRSHRHRDGRPAPSGSDDTKGGEGRG